MILDLPPELFDLVLSFLDTPSFALLLLTSHAVRNKILASSQALHNHLRRTPGLHQCSPNLCLNDPQTLLRQFNERAAQHALNGAAELCDTATYAAEFNTRFRLCQLGKFAGNHDPWDLAAAVDVKTSTVHVYSLQDGFPIPRYAIGPSLLGVDADGYEVLLIRLYEQRGLRRLAILYNYTVQCNKFRNGKPDWANSFQEEAWKNSRKTLKLAVFGLSPSEGAILESLRSIVNKTEYDLKPVVMDLNNVGDAAIAFRVIIPEPGYHYSIRCYPHSAGTFENDTICIPVMGVVAGSSTDGVPYAFEQQWMYALDKPIHHIEFSDNIALNVYHSGTQLPAWHVAACMTASCVIRTVSQPSESTVVKSETFFGAYKWIPLMTGHNHECFTNESGAVCCVNTVLQVAQLDFGLHRGLYLVKASMSQEGCSTFDVNTPFPAHLEHEVVAVIENVESDVDISHGHIIALSKSKTRLAIATWDRILLVSMQPSAFLESAKGSLSKPAGKIRKSSPKKTHRFSNWSYELATPEDWTYSKNTGLGYYRSTRTFKRRRIACLSGVELPHKGIIYKMYFMDDDTLWAWTDCGLVKWYWGAGRRARERDDGVLLVAAPRGAVGTSYQRHGYEMEEDSMGAGPFYQSYD